MKNKICRREFLKTAGTLAGALAVPSFLKSQNYENQNRILVPKGWSKETPYWDMPANSLEVQTSRNLKKTLDDTVVNPFHQPNIIYDQLNCYGGGDYDGFGIGQGDIDAAQAGTNDYRLDVNGDQIINVADANMLQAYKNGNTSYLPGYWNFLQNRTERESWLTKMLAIDKTDEKQWVSGEFISGDFAKLIYANFHGGAYNHPSNLTPLTNGLFNIPLYLLTVANSNFAHGMNVLLTGDNPLDFNDWCPVESQTDQINVQPGEWDIPYNTNLRIFKINGYIPSNSNYSGYTSDSTKLIEFNIDGSGNATAADPNPNLLLTRPTVSVEDEKNYKIGRKYVLDKIYPNPTNAEANISYNLPERNNISIDVYDMLGKKVNTLEKGMQEPGQYTAKWNANNQPSGTYIIRLRNENQILDKGKITIIK